MDMEAMRKMYKTGRALGMSHFNNRGYDIDRACRNASKLYSWAAGKYLEGYMSVATEKGLKITADDFHVTSECIASCQK